MDYFHINIWHSEYFMCHFEHLKKCIEENLYMSAYVHLHILYMLFVYVHIRRIAKNKEQEFNLCLSGFPKRDQDLLKNLDDPLYFSEISEKAVFRFFRVVEFDNSLIGLISKVVDERNTYLHANGAFLSNQEEFEEKFDSYLQKMKMITEKQIPFLREIYKSRILSYDKEFTMNYDEIETNFSNSEHSFSLHELRLLASGRKDVVSHFINTQRV